MLYCRSPQTSWINPSNILLRVEAVTCSVTKIMNDALQKVKKATLTLQLLWFPFFSLVKVNLDFVVTLIATSYLLNKVCRHFSRSIVSLFEVINSVCVINWDRCIWCVTSWHEGNCHQFQRLEEIVDI